MRNLQPQKRIGSVLIGNGWVFSTYLLDG